MFFKMSCVWHVIRLLWWIFTSFVQPPFSVTKATRERRSLHQLTVDTCTKGQKHSKLNVLTVKGSQLASITNTSTHANALHHPPPTPMLVSLHVRDGDIRQKSQSQLNNARSSSWPAHLHGDNWQRRHVFSERYVDVLLLFRSCFCTRPFFDGVECFFGWQKTNGTLFVLV